MIRRLVPSLATELHLTVRLLHVHSSVERSNRTRSLTPGPHREQQPSSNRDIPLGEAVAGTNIKQTGHSQDDGRKGDQSEANIVFETGMDCRSFAARVLLGLRSLLPHVGADTLDLLAGSLAVASEVKLGAQPIS